jgi:hypothetical protein
MEWKHRGSPHQKSENKNCWKNSGFDILGSRSLRPNLLCSKWTNYHFGELLITAGANVGYFDRKTPRKILQGRRILERQCHGPPGTCNQEETGITLFPVS